MSRKLDEFFTDADAQQWLGNVGSRSSPFISIAGANKLFREWVAQGKIVYSTSLNEDFGIWHPSRELLMDHPKRTGLLLEVTPVEEKMKVKRKIEEEIEVKTMSLHLKVSDCFDARLLDAKGAVLADYSDYVPDFMPGEHHGDYVILDIDIDTGQITNWKKPSAKALQAIINPKGEEE